MITSRPVKPRARRIADMVASVPELHMRTSSIDGTSSMILRATTVSISVGAAPGWLIETITSGNSISGSFCTFIREKVIIPPRIRAMNRTIGTTGRVIEVRDEYMPVIDLEKVFDVPRFDFEHVEEVVRRVRMLRNHPGLLAWDEEEGVARGEADAPKLLELETVTVVAGAGLVHRLERVEVVVGLGPAEVALEDVEFNPHFGEIRHGEERLIRIDHLTDRCIPLDDFTGEGSSQKHLSHLGMRQLLGGQPLDFPFCHP